MIIVSQESIETKPETAASLCSSSARRRAWPYSPPALAKPMALRMTASARVTAGPAAATSNSVRAESDSRSMRATPPNSQSWMLVVTIPLRSAAKAWPSSWRTIEPKKPMALATAKAKGLAAVLDSPRASP